MAGQARHDKTWTHVRYHSFSFYFSLMDRFNWDKIVRWCAVGTLGFMVLCGAVMVFWEVHPFFLDEWAIIYNMKYKTAAQLWGGLDKTQQFPRVYLQIINWLSSLFNYSYTSLRLPSFVVHCCGLGYCIYLSGRLFKDNTFYRWLFVLIYAAYPSSIYYFVLTKQYTMEMFMGLVGIAQLVLLININKGKQVSTIKYALLCVSFLVAPMFSYTYPMVAAPIFLVVLINSFSKGQALGKQWFALALCSIGIVALYKVDIQQVMADPGMKNYWKDYYMSNGFNIKELASHIFLYFYNFGRRNSMAFLGVTGLAAWLFSSYKSIVILGKKEKTVMEWLVVYSVGLMWLSVLLFIAGKLPLNAHRLNAYKTAAAGIMIVYLLMQLGQRVALRKVAYAWGGVLFGLQMLFIIQPLVRGLTEADHYKKMRIYNNGKTAIATAQQSKEPMAIFTTSMTLYPHHDIGMSAEWVIMSYPLYDRKKAVPVYPINSGADADALLHTLPYGSVVVTTGDSVWVLENH
jgi:hypothetical protein